MAVAEYYRRKQDEAPRSGGRTLRLAVARLVNIAWVGLAVLAVKADMVGGNGLMVVTACPNVGAAKLLLEAEGRSVLLAGSNRICAAGSGLRPVPRMAPLVAPEGGDGRDEVSHAAWVQRPQFPDGNPFRGPLAEAV
jgi:hypothetical protein